VSENEPIYKSVIKEEPMNIYDIRSEMNRDSGISINLEPNEDLSIVVAAGPYMAHGSTNTTNLNLLIEAVKAKNAHLLILVIFIFCL
jgi:hypothetical protein